MSNDRSIVVGERLDSGMLASEAAARAAHWWDARGRLMMLGKVANDPVMASVSGICGGHVFDRLTREEQVKVIVAWHHFFIRRPDVLDVDPAAKFKLGGEEQVQ